LAVLIKTVGFENRAGLLGKLRIELLGTAKNTVSAPARRLLQIGANFRRIYELVAGQIGSIFSSIPDLLHTLFTAQPEAGLVIITGNHMGNSSTKTTATQHSYFMIINLTQDCSYKITSRRHYKP
jgi:hypothetical protein